ncbi:hypothetical protein GCM10027161_55450 [Microbispora hainanensis]
MAFRAYRIGVTIDRTRVITRFVSVIGDRTGNLRYALETAGSAPVRPGSAGRAQFRLGSAPAWQRFGFRPARFGSGLAAARLPPGSVRLRPGPARSGSGLARRGRGRRGPGDAACPAGPRAGSVKLARTAVQIVTGFVSGYIGTYVSEVSVIGHMKPFTDAQLDLCWAARR